MNLEITLTKKRQFNVLVNDDFYVYVDLDQSTAEDSTRTLKEAELDYIFNEVEKYEADNTIEEENPYDKYGVSESQFLSR